MQGYGTGLVGAIGGGLVGGHIGDAMMQTQARQPEVISEFERMQKAVEVLHMTAETLCARLGPIRNQCGGLKQEQATSAPSPVLCSVADRIRADRQRLEAIQSELQRALNELEI